MNTQKMKIRSRLLIGTLSFLACTRPSTLPEPQASPTEASAPESSRSLPAEKTSSGSWEISPTSEIQHYSTLITTSIQQSAAGQTSSDSITTRAQYGLSTTRSANLIILTGSIEAFAIQTGNRIGSDSTSESYPVSFAGRIINHQLQLDITRNISPAVSTTLPCGLPARTALTVIERNLLITPLHLQSGASWQDSLTSTACSGSLELNLTIFRNYRVLGENVFNGIPALVIDVTEKTLSTGEGSQDQHRLIVKGQALKSGRFYLDKINGSIINTLSETHTTLEITTSGRVQQFIQISKEMTNRM